MRVSVVIPTFERAALLLQQADALLAGTPASAEFGSEVLAPGLDLVNTIRAYRARYELFAGNYQAAIDAAHSVDESVASTFAYDGLASNPIFTAFYIGTPSYAARDDLGIENPEAGDQRIPFYTDDLDAVSDPNGLPIDVLTGFFDDGESGPLPAYLPGEMALIRAEAYVRLNQLNNAVAEINAVRTKTPAQDPFGVGASLPAYAGPVTEAALLAEIFYQRSAELYLQGLRMADGRRLGQGVPDPSDIFQRTRNFYPYPQQERITNPGNVPADPAI